MKFFSINHGHNKNFNRGLAVLTLPVTNNFFLTMCIGKSEPLFTPLHMRTTSISPNASVLSNNFMLAHRLLTQSYAIDFSHSCILQIVSVPRILIILIVFGIDMFLRLSIFVISLIFYIE